MDKIEVFGTYQVYHKLTYIYWQNFIITNDNKVSLPQNVLNDNIPKKQNFSFFNDLSQTLKNTPLKLPFGLKRNL